MMPRHNFGAAVKQAHTWKAGQHIFRAGDEVGSLYWVRSGTVKNYFTSEAGEEQVLGFFLPGEILGMEAVKSGYYGCSAVALETSNLCQLPLSQLTTQTESHTTLTQLCADTVARDYAALWLLSKKGAEQRLAGFLLDLSKRYGRCGFSSSEYRLTMSRLDIGNYLGLALGTVSRLLSEFEAAGLIDVQRRYIRLSNTKGLRALTGDCPWLDLEDWSPSSSRSKRARRANDEWYPAVAHYLPA